MLEIFITNASRELYAIVKPYLGKTGDMSDDDWTRVIAQTNKTIEECRGTLAFEYAMKYGLLLLDELDREARRERKAEDAA